MTGLQPRPDGNTASPPARFFTQRPLTLAKRDILLTPEKPVTQRHFHSHSSLRISILPMEMLAFHMVVT